MTLSRSNRRRTSGCSIPWTSNPGNSDGMGKKGSPANESHSSSRIGPDFRAQVYWSSRPIAIFWATIYGPWASEGPRKNKTKGPYSGTMQDSTTLESCGTEWNDQYDANDALPLIFPIYESQIWNSIQMEEDRLNKSSRLIWLVGKKQKWLRVPNQRFWVVELID